MSKIILLFLLIGLNLPIQVQAQSPKPNFVVILADDMGYADLSGYGAPLIKTPNIDALAAQGIKFTDFYSNSAVCCPTRAAFLTGRYSTRVGIDHVIPLNGTNSGNGLKDSEVTLPEVLKPLGYATTLIGKWHLGHLEQYNPTLHGFDSFYGLAYSNDYNGGNVPLYRDTQIIENPTTQNLLTSKFTTEALSFIDQNKSKPFFLYLAYTAPHVPLYANPAWAGESAGGLYGDVVEEMDWGVGQVVAKLKALGLENNTLVIFASDNGPWIYHGENAGSSGPFYCGKGSYYEGGIRVPMIAKWPGKIATNKVSNQVGAIYDLYPTFIELAGGNLPSGKVIDGQDLAPVLFNNSLRADDDIVFTYLDAVRAIRMGKWKYLTSYGGGSAWMDECGEASHGELLFNMTNDPGEKTNLMSQYPAVASFLKGELTAFQQSLSSSNQPPVANFTTTQFEQGYKLYIFDASTSNDKDGNIVSYAWNFGDGSTGNGVSVNHTYTNNGNYTVTLKATDNGGLTDGKLVDLTIPLGSPQPSASLNPSPSNSPSASPFKKGDVNHDGSVNYLDMRVILNNFSSLASSVPNYFDPVGDGKINIFDAAWVVKDW